jgi:hypothetical protein
MPNFIMPEFEISRQTEDDWRRAIAKEIRRGKTLPLISNAVCNDLVFGSNKALVEGLAASIRYPLPDKDNLIQMTQFDRVMYKAGNPKATAAHWYVKNKYLAFLERALYEVADGDLLNQLRADPELETLTLSEKASRLECPRLDPANPLVRLAQFPLPIYLTTSYHAFLETALEREDKKPRSEISRWNVQLESIPEVLKTRSLIAPERVYEPTPDEPLVYHLHGMDTYPESLVLTEDDHLDFMAAILRNKEVIPLRVRQALADSSLILLGYDLRGLDFKVIFRSLIKTSNTHLRPKSVAIQLSPADQNEKDYLENHLRQEAEFEVCWETTPAFVEELWSLWSNPGNLAVPADAGVVQ